MVEKQVLRGFLANIEVVPPLIVTFQFNPETISDNKAVHYAERHTSLGEDTPGKVYTGGGERTISFEIKLHGLEQGTNALNPTPVDNGITVELAKLRSFMYPKADAWATVGGSGEGRWLSPPPTCVFGFGTKILECVVTGMEITETQFNSALAPVRAEAKITLTVIEAKDNKFYASDKARRNALAAHGIQNIRPF